MNQTMGDYEILQETDIILQNSPEEFSIDPPDYYPAAIHHRHQHHPHHHSPCSSCGCSGHSRKRPSIPSQTTHHPNPAKKLFLDIPPPDHHHHSAADSASVPLRRTVSDCLAASGSGISSNALPEQANLSATPGSASDSSHRLRPPLPPTLQRSVSVPIPSPLPQPESKSLSRTSSSSAEDSDKNTSSSKRNKMLSSLREFDKLMEEELEAFERQRQDVVPSKNDNNEHNDNGLVNNTTNKDDSMAEFEEWLSVEKVGERMNIHFKCHCGNGYQFLVVDGNCFYKLM